ncbi:helix-turn-helix domain-containing protein [uncultured Gimesia sp.]|jgi:transposase|uniref:helix-turn-helix domain-containing protein n=1 Tax=uncultured Gimesia sp. TaxID=1678688 RepID=UPI00260A9378|nr:helix-turn-helix domain-containing protein [uncultured Gimesia sp.]
MLIYSKERRLEVLKAYAAGLTTREIALQFQCSESWVRRVKQEFREHGKTSPATRRKRVPQWHSLVDRIQTSVSDKPDITLQELKDRLGTTLCRQTLCRALKRLKLTLKKKS